VTDALARAETVAELWRRDPVAWALGVFPASCWPNEWQRETLDLLRSPSMHKLALKGLRGCGKSTLLAMIALHRASTIPGSLTIIAAGYSRQLQIGTWNELRRLFRASEVLRALFPSWEILTDRIATGDETRVLAFASDDPRAIEGAHGEHVAILIDEARSLDQAFYYSLRALLTGPDHLLVAAGTSGAPSGWWYRIWSRDNRDLYDQYVSIDIAEVPHLRERMQSELRLLGPTDPIYRTEWLSEFVDAGEWGLYPLALIEKAVGHDPYVETEFRSPLDRGPIHPIVIGADPAQSGDANTIAIVRHGDGWAVCEQIVELPRGTDAMMTAGAIVQVARQYHATAIGVDKIGYGAGIYSRVQEVLASDRRVRVGGYIASERARDPEVYFNKKSEQTVAVKRLLEEGKLGLPNDPTLIREMCSMQLRITSNGKTKVEDSPGDSPDHFDAMLVALNECVLYRPGIVLRHVSWI
jgi:Terminase RNaseH-like domain